MQSKMIFKYPLSLKTVLVAVSMLGFSFSAQAAGGAQEKGGAAPPILVINPAPAPASDMSGDKAVSDQALSLDPAVAQAEIFGPVRPVQDTQDVSAQDLRHVLGRTYTNNPSLKAARAELKAVEEKLSQALSGWRPTVSADGSVSVTDVEGSSFGGDGSTPKDISLSLNQPLFRGGRTLAQTKAARHTIEAQTALVAAEEQDVLLEAATAYMDVLRDGALLELSGNNREVIARQLEATRYRFEVGELTKTDVSQAEARLARSESEKIKTRGDLQASKARMVQITDVVPEALEQPSLVLPVPGTLDEALAVADTKSPLVIAALSGHRAAEEDVDGIFGELLPELEFFGSWNRTYDPSPGVTDEQTTELVGVSAHIPLYQAGAVRSRVREAKHRANQRFMEIQEAKRQVRESVVSAWEALEAARAEIEARQAQVEASRTAQEGVHAEAEFGSRTVLDSLDADQEFLDAQVALVTAERNKIVAEFTLLSKLGALTPEVLGFADMASAASGTENSNMGVDRLGSGG
ncbi:MAG: TolC family outer membrane protein [Alphaproteobacteria bacterium]|nr:TolC family outer membrane protein [Alphaproteobacteria bacterium]